jgi:acylpyruvate hydrolase
MRLFKFKNGQALEVRTMYCIGKNYAKHAAEMGGVLADEPIVFMKPPAAFIENNSWITLPSFSNNVHHEVELVVVIGKECNNIQEDEALDYIAGYAVGIDITLRDIQEKAKKDGHPWTVAKGFYSSAPVSEVIPSEEFNGTIPDFDLYLKVNDIVKQESSTRYMERPVGKLIEYLSKVFTLEPGDCIFTGTPEGVGPIKSGDDIYAELKGYVNLSIHVE